MISRRGAMGGLMSWWAAGNARRPMGPQAREAERPDRRPLGVTRAGVGPAPQQGTFIGRLVIISGPGAGISGVFLYQPSPAAANLSSSYSESTADPYGDKIIPGSVAFYNPGLSQATALQATGLGGFTGSFAAGWTLASEVTPAGDSIGFSAGGGSYTLIGPSGDTTGVKDSAVFANLGTGTIYLLMPGIYFVNAPIVVPTGAHLAGFTSWQANPVASFALPLQGTIIKPVAAFSGSAVLSLTSTGSGNGSGQEISGVAIDGSSLPAGTVHGLSLTGPVCAASFRDMVIQHVTGDGIHLAGSGGNPDQLLFQNIGIHQAGAHGVNQTTGVSDTTWFNIWVSASASDNWAITNGGESYWIRCRGENATAGWGFNFTSFTGFTGTVNFVDCETTGNPSGGFLVQGAGAGVFNLQWCHAGDTTKWSYTNTGAMVVNSPAAFNVSTAAPTFC